MSPETYVERRARAKRDRLRMDPDYIDRHGIHCDECDGIAITTEMMADLNGGEPLACGCSGKVGFDDEDGRVWLECGEAVPA